MIVFNLGCEEGHRFEGWFASAEDFERQQLAGMLQCPTCGEKSVARLPSAPRLNLTSGSGAPPHGETGSPPPPTTEEAASRARLVAAKTEFYRHLQRMLERSDDVGERFAEEARRIHYKETPERQIHGVATRQEAIELLEEGVAVLPLPDAIKRKGELN